MDVSTCRGLTMFVKWISGVSPRFIKSVWILSRRSGLYSRKTYQNEYIFVFLSIGSHTIKRGSIGLVKHLLLPKISFPKFIRSITILSGSFCLWPCRMSGLPAGCLAHTPDIWTLISKEQHMVVLSSGCPGFPVSPDVWALPWMFVPSTSSSAFYFMMVVLH